MKRYLLVFRHCDEVDLIESIDGDYFLVADVVELVEGMRDSYECDKTTGAKAGMEFLLSYLHGAAAPTSAIQGDSDGT